MNVANNIPGVSSLARKAATGISEASLVNQANRLEGAAPGVNTKTGKAESFTSNVAPVRNSKGMTVGVFGGDKIKTYSGQSQFNPLKGGSTFNEKTGVYEATGFGSSSGNILDTQAKEPTIVTAPKPQQGEFVANVAEDLQSSLYNNTRVSKKTRFKRFGGGSAVVKSLLNKT